MTVGLMKGKANFMQELTAFEKYLLKLPLRNAVTHVLDCLKSSDGTQAWELMEEFNGPDWKCPPAEIGNLVARTIVSLGLKQISTTGAHNE